MFAPARGGVAAVGGNFRIWRGAAAASGVTGAGVASLELRAAPREPGVAPRELVAAPLSLAHGVAPGYRNFPGACRSFLRLAAASTRIWGELAPGEEKPCGLRHKPPVGRTVFGLGRGRCGASAGAEVLGDLVCGQRAGEQEALHHAALAFEEEIPLGVGLDARR